MESQTARGGRGDNAPWQHRRGDIALALALGCELAADDSIDIVPDALSEADMLDREMEERGHLMRAVEPTPADLAAARRAWLRCELARGMLPYSPADDSDSVDYPVAPGVSVAGAIVGTVCLLVLVVVIALKVIGGAA